MNDLESKYGRIECVVCGNTIYQGGQIDHITDDKIEVHTCSQFCRNLLLGVVDMNTPSKIDIDSNLRNAGVSQ